MPKRSGTTLGTAQFRLFLRRRREGTETGSGAERLKERHLRGLNGKARRVALDEAKRTYARRYQEWRRRILGERYREYRTLHQRVARQRARGKVRKADLQRLREIKRILGIGR